MMFLPGFGGYLAMSQNQTHFELTNQNEAEKS